MKELDGFGGKNSLVENFIISESIIALGIDISNSEKHGVLRDSKSGKTIGVLNSHVHIFDSAGNDRTELTIEIDGVKNDCLVLAAENLKAWKKFFNSQNLRIL